MAKKKYKTEWPRYDLFAKLLDEHGVNTLYVSKVTGVNSTSLYEWKSGRSYPKEDKLKKLALFFDVPMNYFQDGQKHSDDNNKISVTEIEGYIREIVREEIRIYFKETFKLL